MPPSTAFARLPASTARYLPRATSSMDDTAPEAVVRGSTRRRRTKESVPTPRPVFRGRVIEEGQNPKLTQEGSNEEDVSLPPANPAVLNDATVPDDLTMKRDGVESPENSRDSTASSNASPYRFRSVLFTLFLSAVSLLAYAHSLGLLQAGTWASATNLRALPITSPVTMSTLLPHSSRLDGSAETHGEDGAFVVAFYSHECLACRRMREPFTRAAARVAESGSSVPFYAVDVGEGKSSAKREILREFNVRFVPAVYVVAADGRRFQYKGARDAQKLSEFVERSVDEFVHGNGGSGDGN